MVWPPQQQCRRTTPFDSRFTPGENSSVLLSSADLGLHKIKIQSNNAKVVKKQWNEILFTIYFHNVSFPYKLRSEGFKMLLVESITLQIMLPDKTSLLSQRNVIYVGNNEKWLRSSVPAPLGYHFPLNSIFPSFLSD